MKGKQISCTCMFTLKSKYFSISSEDVFSPKIATVIQSSYVKKEIRYKKFISRINDKSFVSF